MNEKEDIELLKKSLLSGNPLLFLGAGFSRESVCHSGKMPTGEELIKELMIKFIKGKVTDEELKEIGGYKLRELCECINSINGSKEQLNNYLTQKFSGVRPTNERGFHYKVLEYPWVKIYSTNIDDLLENIFEDKKRAYTSMFCNEIPKKVKGTEIIKLHGCSRHSELGYIFSRKEYADLISKGLDARLLQFTTDLISNDIIFVGTSLDEPDVEHYIGIYENSGYKSRINRIFFIEPYPTLALKQRAEHMKATIITWTTSQFLEYVSQLAFNPEELQKLKIELNYNSIFGLSEIRKTFEEVYESSIYEGFTTTWQDIFDDWTYKNHKYLESKIILDQLVENKNKVKCFCIYGEAFSGKSTLIKQLAKELYISGYEVLEYKGVFLNRELMLKYIEKTQTNKFVLLVDNASYYYKLIEKMYQYAMNENELIILCASRSYYHESKKYYLDGNYYLEYKCQDIIHQEDTKEICSKLIEKGYLGYLANIKGNRRFSEVMKNGSLVNFILELTYGKGLRKKILSQMKKINNLSKEEQKLLVELAIFDGMDLEYYPKELFCLRFGNHVDIHGKIDINNMKVIDYIKYDEQGLSLRNNLLQKEILHNISNKDKIERLKYILMYISRYVIEENNDIWTIIFQSLAKVELLRSNLKINNKKIRELLYSLKTYYGENSYYWLQLGILEQVDHDFVKALSHLQMSSEIRPNSFKIQHAIARNYLRHANNEKSINIAQPLFERGEELMKGLIESKEYYKRKAKPFSIHSYVEEKIKYIQKFNYNVTNNELYYMRDILDEIANNDEVAKTALHDFYKLLLKLNKQNILSLKPGSPYFDVINTKLDK